MRERERERENVSIIDRVVFPFSTNANLWNSSRTRTWSLLRQINRLPLPGKWDKATSHCLGYIYLPSVEKGSIEFLFPHPLEILRKNKIIFSLPKIVLLFMNNCIPSFRGLLRWPCVLRRCHWLLTFSHHCLGSKPGLDTWENCQWLGIKRWFSAGLLVSSTSYEWLGTT